MLYAEVISDIVTQYPLTIFQFRTMYPNVSWPDEPTAEALALYNLVIVYETTPPTINRNQTLTEETPEYNSTSLQWEQTWVVTSKSLAGAKIKEKEFLAEIRFEAEVAGIDWEYAVNDTVTAYTDRESQMKYCTGFLMAHSGIWESGKQWKFKNDEFRPLTPEHMISVATAVSNHVQWCFEHEHTIAHQIDTATTLEDVENWTW